jgi:hypothetical protein
LLTVPVPPAVSHPFLICTHLTRTTGLSEGSELQTL